MNQRVIYTSLSEVKRRTGYDIPVRSETDDRYVHAFLYLKTIEYLQVTTQAGYRQGCPEGQDWLYPVQEWCTVNILWVIEEKKEKKKTNCQ